jgi:hypothetical protein
MIVEGRYMQRQATDAADRRYLARAVAYLTTSRTSEHYPLFTAGADRVARATTTALLMDRRDAEVLAHRHILSPDPRLLMKGEVELSALVRAIYAAWAMERGWGRVEYAGAIHLNTGVPHVHVLVGGQIGTAGAGRALHLWPADYAALKRVASAVIGAAAASGKERRRTLRALGG